MALASAFIACSGALAADEPIFSGPQVGEKLPAFKVRGVFDDEAGKELDFVSKAAGKPIVLVFVHDVNRQSVSMTRVLTGYTTSRAKDGLTTGVVWLNDDATEAENSLKRMRHALTPSASNGISMDGREGPGSYGLNRNVTLTILVGKDGKVTGNFALVQPSLQADLPKILESVVAVAGGKVPKLEELDGMREMMRRAPSQDQAAPNLRPLLMPVIKLDASKEDVEKAAKALEEHVAKDEAAKKELGRIASTIVNAGKVENYGTASCQEYLKKWAKEYGPKTDAAKDAPREQKNQP
ncbi:hypothetical protein AYO47_00900 [Planctomyces sp. SCGC AG-212-M04]|nr:hypothetical protein AYO47_00900 [Planctomyces sp. SCGC AG-212-M04]